MHNCHYCKIFQNIDSKLRRKEGNTIFRYCKKKGEEVESNSEVCKYFRPSQYFWCKKDSNWMYVISCLNRTYRCKQKKDVLNAIRGFDIRKEFGMKPVLVQRKIEKVKPVLMKRVK